jgi:sugar/nucleoside kinase (ribokinase family)
MFKLIVVGSITEDHIITPDDESSFIGGVPVYAASVAKALAAPIGVVSKVGTDFQIKNLTILKKLDADLSGFKIAGSTSMAFENRYDKKGKRTQKVLSTSEKIKFKDIPHVYFQAPCIHLGPVYNEIDEQLIIAIKDQFNVVSLDGQGFTRTVENSNGTVQLEPWFDYKKYFPLVDVLKVDDTELKAITGTTRLREAIKLALEASVKLLVITRAYKGAIIYHGRKRHDIPAIPTDVVDATGAGDTFITAFLIEYLRTRDCYYSGLIAAAAASFKISTAGPLPKYTKKDVITRLKDFSPAFQEK